MIGSGWSYDRNSLDDALDLWRRDWRPTDFERECVDEWLAGALDDPAMMGQEDDDTGIFYARVMQTNIAIVYVPSREEMKIYMSSIAPQPSST